MSAADLAAGSEVLDLGRSFGARRMVGVVVEVTERPARGEVCDYDRCQGLVALVDFEGTVLPSCSQTLRVSRQG